MRDSNMQAVHIINVPLDLGASRRVLEGWTQSTAAQRESEGTKKLSRSCSTSRALRVSFLRILSVG